MGATHGYSPLQPEEEEMQQEPSLAEKICVCMVVFMVLSTVVILVVACIGGLIFYMVQASQGPHYYVSVDSVSGLDPATDIGQKPALHPQFNLTLRVASMGYWDEECFKPGMYVVVSYRGIPLASTATLMERQVCAQPGKAVDHRLVTGGTGVVVPGSVLDGLAMDMRGGMLMVDVELRGWGWRSCGKRAVGDAAAIQKEC
ncbi:hypothetical protein ZWY2020_023791 [Hordeum vulgare]|nr:hypothetical protein ZWY2020_023791 [Hordeum vulgare]